MKINIAGISFNLNIQSGFVDTPIWLDKFFHDCTLINSTLCYTQTNDIIIHGDMLCSEGGISWWINEFGFEVTITNKQKRPIAILSANKDWSMIEIKKTREASSFVFKTLSEIVFRNVLLFHEGIVIHASAVVYKGKGFIFSAPSGVGKSTQADLWVKHKGAEILNADRPALRVLEDGVRVYGTPWSGTSNQQINESATLEAIFMLEQSPINEVSKLTLMEALQRIIARCFLPYFDRKLMEIALDNIGDVLARTPVYLLKCRPDSEAVDAVASYLGL